MKDIFTVPVNTTPTIKVVEEAIKFNEKFRSVYDKLENYYLGEHDVLNRVKIEGMSNNRVVVNHARYITDINVGYLLGNPVEYQSDEGFDIERILEEYDKAGLPDIDHETARNVSIFGRAYERVYNVGNDIYTTPVDVRNCVIVYDDTVQHKKLFAIIYEKKSTNDGFVNVEVITDSEVISYAKNGALSVGDSEKNPFTKISVIEYRNNSQLQGDFEQVISMIDAYNIVQSDRVNDKEQLVEAILALYGFDMTSDQALQLKRDKMITAVPSDAKAEYIVKNVNETDADTLRRVIEADIHKISMTPNLSDENFVGNSSGVAIRYKLLAFEQSVMNKERYFERGLLDRMELYNLYLNGLESIAMVPKYKVDVVFKRNLPQNDYEISQMIVNLDGKISEETAVSQLSFVKDASEEIEVVKKEKAERANLESQFYGSNQANQVNDEQDNLTNNINDTSRI